MRRILLIRHGQTEWNRQQVFRGRADIALSKVGIEQAIALAERPAEEPVAAVHSRPLSRALVTVEYAARPRGSTHREAGQARPRRMPGTHLLPERSR